MRHIVVRRVSVLLGMLLLILAVGFAWLVRDVPPGGDGDEAPAAGADAPAPAPAGAALYRRYCSGCHPDEEALRVPLREGGAEVRAEFEAFLDGHGDASGDEDRLILDYLAAEGPR